MPASRALWAGCLHIGRLGLRPWPSQALGVTHRSIRTASQMNPLEDRRLRFIQLIVGVPNHYLLRLEALPLDLLQMANQYHPNLAFHPYFRFNQYRGNFVPFSVLDEHDKLRI